MIVSISEHLEGSNLLCVKSFCVLGKEVQIANVCCTLHFHFHLYCIVYGRIHMNSRPYHIWVIITCNFNYHGIVLVVDALYILAALPAPCVKPAYVKFFINGNILFSKSQIPNMGFIIVVSKPCRIDPGSTY